MPSPQSELFERDGELHELSEVLVRAGGGHGALLAIEGPAGIGKTRLLDELRQRAVAADMEVLAARGSELERGFAFGVVRQLFEGALAAGGDELLAGAAGLARPLFFEGAALPAAGQEAFALLHGLFWLTADIAAERPLVLAIDDLHWCDGESLRFLEYLARRLDGLPLLVALAARPGESADATRLVATADMVRPSPLTARATGELIRAQVAASADDVFCATCHEASGGNPLLLRELTRALVTEGVEPVAANARRVTEIGADAVAVAVRLRLEAMSPAAARLAEAAAVLGDGSELYTAGALAGLGEEECDAAGLELARADVLHGEPEFTFAHPLVRAAVLASLPLGARERAHARAARLLHDSGAPAEQIAAHVAAAPPRDDPEAVETLRMAARSSLARGGAEAAVSYLRRALAEPPTRTDFPDVLFELGSAEQLLHGPSSVEHLRWAIEMGEGAPWRGEAALALGRTLTFAGDVAEAATVLQSAIAERPAEGRDDVRGLLEAALLLISVTEARFRPLS